MSLSTYSSEHQQREAGLLVNYRCRQAPPHVGTRLAVALQASLSPVHSLIYWAPATAALGLRLCIGLLLPPDRNEAQPCQTVSPQAWPQHVLLSQSTAGTASLGDIATSR